MSTQAGLSNAPFAVGEPVSIACPASSRTASAAGAEMDIKLSSESAEFASQNDFTESSTPSGARSRYLKGCAFKGECNTQSGCAQTATARCAYLKPSFPQAFSLFLPISLFVQTSFLCSDHGYNLHRRCKYGVSGVLPVALWVPQFLVLY